MVSVNVVIYGYQVHSSANWKFEYLEFKKYVWLIFIQPKNDFIKNNYW